MKETKNKIEMYNQVEIETCIPDYIDPQIHLPYVLRRVPGQSSRWYFEIENNLPVFYLGATSMLQRYLPTPNPIIRWMCSFPTYEDAMDALETEGYYGTFMHKVFAMITIDGSFSLNDNDIKDEILAFLEMEKINVDRIPLSRWIKNIKQDVISFFHWKKDYKIKVIAVELTLRSKTLKIAGTIDYLCEATLPVIENGKKKKGEFERAPIYVDFKKNRKAFYPNQHMQLLLYRALLKENFPDFEDIRCFLLGMKNYNLPIGKSVTPYRFKEIDYKYGNKLKHYCRLFKEENLSPSFKTKFKDIVIDKTTNLDDIYVDFDMDQFIQDKKRKDYNETENNQINLNEKL